MTINRILHRDLTLFNISGNSKKRVLESVAEYIHQHDNNIDAAELFKQLTARERLGSTAIGKGIAIPHCRSDQVQSTVGCLVKLQHAIDFDAQDDEWVDILFILVVPENSTDEHLTLLAELASLMNSNIFRDRLRQSQNSDELYNAAVHFEQAA